MVIIIIIMVTILINLCKVMTVRWQQGKKREKWKTATLGELENIFLIQDLIFEFSR